jgi:predicted methyltransferase
MNRLREVYKKFLAYEKKRFLQDSGEWFGVGKVSQKTKEEFFDNYYKISFCRFLTNVKNLVYSPSPFDFIEKGWGDNWELESYIDFLKKENLISLKKEKISVKDKDFFDYIPRPRSEQEIKQRIEKNSQVSIKGKEPVTDLINKFSDFKVKGQWDQMPLSQSSAIFSVKKILDYLPLKKKFLFIGDDDFLSVFLSLADKQIESVVIDADQDLLESIDSIASRFNLKIETFLVDTRKKVKLDQEFIGFSCNPPYTEKGVASFLEYGINQLNNDGGNVFLAMGTENIGNRLLFLQEFFAKKNLAIMEMIAGKLSYPYLDLHEEDQVNLKRMKKFFSEKTIRNNPRLAADLWIFDYFPFKVEKLKKENSIYSYL